MLVLLLRQLPLALPRSLIAIIDALLVLMRRPPRRQLLLNDCDDATARFDVAWTVSTAPPTDDADAGIGFRLPTSRGKR